MTTPTNTSPSRGTAQSLATPPRYIIPRTTPVLHPPPPGMLVKLQNSVTLILHIFYIALLYSTVCTYVLCQFSFIGCLFSHTHQKISHVTVMWHHMSPVFVFLAHQSRNVLEPSSLAADHYYREIISHFVATLTLPLSNVAVAIIMYVIFTCLNFDA